MIFQISLGVDIRAHELCLVCLKASSRSVQLVGARYLSLQRRDHRKWKSTVLFPELIQEFYTGESGFSHLCVFRNSA